MTQAIFDQNVFLQSLADDKELADELLGAFLEDSPIRSQSLGAALESEDAGEVARLAHSLKGMCGVVRAANLVNLALSMETAAKGGDLDKTRTQYDIFTEMLDAAHIEMKAFIG